MGNISSNTLFHFTDLNGLLGILKSEYHPRYSIETYYKENSKTYKVAIPMVCFCDIPLAQIQEHMQAYGHYGIGMTKRWAKKNRLNPVLYLESNSLLFEKIESVLQHNYDDLKTLIECELEISTTREDRYSLLNIFMHTKPFEGTHEKNGISMQKKFYDEREWRYIPNINRLNGVELPLSSLSINEIDLRANNELLKDHKLSFEPDDIEYLIVKNEIERSDLISNIQNIKSKYTEDKRLILISKVISAEQILTDI